MVSLTQSFSKFLTVISGRALRQLKTGNPFTEQRPLDDMALDLGRTFDDSPSPRVTKITRQHMALAQHCRPRDLQREIDDLVQQLSAKQFHVGRLRSNVHF